MLHGPTVTGGVTFEDDAVVANDEESCGSAPLEIGPHRFQPADCHPLVLRRSRRPIPLQRNRRVRRECHCNTPEREEQRCRRYERVHQGSACAKSCGEAMPWCSAGFDYILLFLDAFVCYPFCYASLPFLFSPRFVGVLFACL